ncbi:hypothetical protein [Psychrobacillus vulpis]|uniref:Uncharacterized protein n=1 Tax=Psychrobacillus vulpis TaxID=2325572 RepID=A0A544TT65_9BACI|nr:hypothetical protein [Psychrobacillus vulpis]TQR20629.1 hypothetical protein FG384_05905 [Psychrobacillus vulpis]
MELTKIRKTIWFSISLGTTALLLTSASIPSIFGSQLGLNPFHVLKIVALISFVTAFGNYIKFKRLKPERKQILL